MIPKTCVLNAVNFTVFSGIKSPLTQVPKSHATRLRSHQVPQISWSMHRLVSEIWLHFTTTNELGCTTSEKITNFNQDMHPIKIG